MSWKAKEWEEFEEGLKRKGLFDLYIQKEGGTYADYMKEEENDWSFYNVQDALFPAIEMEIGFVKQKEIGFFFQQYRLQATVQGEIYTRFLVPLKWLTVKPCSPPEEKYRVEYKSNLGNCYEAQADQEIEHLTKWLTKLHEKFVAVISEEYGVTSEDCVYFHPTYHPNEVYPYRRVWADHLVDPPLFYEEGAGSWVLTASRGIVRPFKRNGRQLFSVNIPLQLHAWKRCF